jgi:hypothetical membrane protein
MSLGGVVGPAAFVAAWVTAGARTHGYSPTDDAISRLAAQGAPTRALMTAGFVAFGVGVPAYAVALRRNVTGHAWATAAASGVATLGVALAPLDHSSTMDLVHGALATSGYVTLALTPLLAAASFRRAGMRGVAAVSSATAVVAGACLAATAIAPWHGLLQRTGLTLLDAWVVATAAAMAAGRLARSSPGATPLPPPLPLRPLRLRLRLRRGHRR